MGVGLIVIMNCQSLQRVGERGLVKRGHGTEKLASFICLYNFTFITVYIFLQFARSS